MVEKMQVTGNRPPGRPKGTLEQLVQGREGIEGGAGIGLKRMEKVDCRTTDVREEGEKRESV